MQTTLHVGSNSDATRPAADHCAILDDANGAPAHSSVSSERERSSLDTLFGSPPHKRARHDSPQAVSPYAQADSLLDTPLRSLSPSAQASGLIEAPSVHWASLEPPLESPVTQRPTPTHSIARVAHTRAILTFDQAIDAVLYDGRIDEVPDDLLAELHEAQHLSVGLHMTSADCVAEAVPNMASLMDVPAEHWRMLFAAMPRLRQVDFTDVAQGLPLFLRMAFGGMPLEQLTHLHFGGVHFDRAALIAFFMQTPRLTHILDLTMPNLPAPRNKTHDQAKFWQRPLIGLPWNKRAQKPSGHRQPVRQANEEHYFADFGHMRRLQALRWQLPGGCTFPFKLTDNHNLRVLTLRGNNDHFVAHGGLPQAFMNALDLSACGLEETCGAALAAAPYHSTLRRLDLSFNPKLVRLDLSEFSALQTVALRGTFPGAAQVLLPAPSVMELLDLRDNSGADGIFLNLPPASHPRLATLLLAGTKICGNLHNINFASMPILGVLDLARTGLTHDDLSAINLSAQNTIYELRLTGNPLGTQGIRSLLRLPLPALRTLHLDDCGLDIESAVALAGGGGLRARWPKLGEIHFGDIKHPQTYGVLRAITENANGASLGWFGRTTSR